MTATVTQCKSCPWRVDCDPERDIPNGYSVELHERLAGTCVSGLASMRPGTMRVMACHYSKPGEEIHCAGWLRNQIDTGNIAVRLAVAVGTMPAPVVDGDQHERFEDTLPESAQRRRSSR